jgi:hypothetical protein
MKIAKVLIDKYWKGISSLKEEKWLKSRYARKSEQMPDAVYFRYLQEKAGETLDDPAFEQAILAAIKGDKVQKRGQFSGMNWRIAAVITLLVIGSITFKIGYMSEQLTPREVVAVDTYQDPEQALEETKKALLFISTQLNRGGSYTTEFSKFNESQEKLKQE